MSSEIGNKSLLKRLADYLQILDVKQFASRLKTDEVIPVIDVGPGMGATYESGTVEEYSVAGSTAVQFYFINQAAGACLTDDGRFDRRVLSAAFHLYFNSEPPLGTRIKWEWVLLNIASNIRHTVSTCIWSMSYNGLNGSGPAGAGRWYFPLGGWNGIAGILGDPGTNLGISNESVWWNGIVPTGYVLYAEVTCFNDYPTTWPAGTMIGGAIHCAKGPRGVLLPN